MDFSVHDIKTFVHLANALDNHARHKKTGVPRPNRGLALYRTEKSPPCFPVPCEHLNVNHVAVDFAEKSEINRLLLLENQLPAWQCYEVLPQVVRTRCRDPPHFNLKFHQNF